MTAAAQRNGHAAHKEPIGAIVKAARLRHKLTADDVAAACNVSRSRVYQWESGTYIFPKNFPTIAMALHIPVKRLRDHNGRRP